MNSNTSLNRPPPTIILPDHPEAATLRTVTGWVSRQGRFYGDDERLARWDGSTHRVCDACGGLMDKQGYCTPCHHKKMVERYNAFPVIEWDGECMLTDYDGDNYWADPGEFLEWCAYNDVEDPSDLMLVATEPIRMREITSENWDGELPDDVEIPADIAEAIEALNKVIRASKPKFWKPSKKRIVIDVPADYKVEA